MHSVLDLLKEQSCMERIEGQQLLYITRFCLFFKNYLFIFFWLRWVFFAARGLSLVAGSKGYSSLQYAGFSLRWLLLLRSTGSR